MMEEWNNGKMEECKDGKFEKKLCCSDAVLRMFIFELFRRNRKMKLCNKMQWNFGMLYSPVFQHSSIPIFQNI